MIAFAAASVFVACAGSGSPTRPVPHLHPPSAPPTLDVPKLVTTATPAPDPSGTMRFGRRVARVGDHRLTLVRAKSTSTGATGASDVVIYESQFDETVVAVEGPAASRVDVIFAHNTLDGTPTSIDNKTYIVDVHAPNVLDAGTNTAPSADEIQRVLDVVPDLGTRTTIDQILPDRPLAPHDHVDEIAEAIVRILHPRFWRLDHGTAVLGSVRDGEAHFAVTIEATSLQSGMKINVEGDVIIRVRDSQLGMFELKGTFMRPNGETGQLETSRVVPTVLSP